MRGLPPQVANKPVEEPKRYFVTGTMMKPGQFIELKATEDGKAYTGEVHISPSARRGGPKKQSYERIYAKQIRVVNELLFSIIFGRKTKVDCLIFGL